MLLGLLDGSIVNFAFMRSCVPMVTVVSSSLQTRLAVSRMASGMAFPSADPDTMDHWPWSWALSFLMASLSSVQAVDIATAAIPIRNAVGNVFIDEFGLACGEGA